MNKSSQQKCFFAAQGLCAANQAKPGLLYFYSAVATHFGLCASVKICYALPLHKAIIVLPDFTRSCSTDREPHLNPLQRRGLKKSVGTDNKGGPA
jgi:hypothetical protein